MDADAPGRALELRVAELELRLRRLEDAQGHPAADPEPPVVTAAPAFVAPSTPAAAPPPPPPPPRMPVAAAWAPKGEPASLGATRQVAAETATLRPGPGPGPVPREPLGRVSLADLEARLTGRALAWVGGLALVLGAIFFLSLAFTRGWIGPEARVIIGLLAG